MLNASFLSGLSGVNFFTIAGNALYASEQNSNDLRAFNLTTGAVLAGFTTITGLNSPEGVVLSGNHLLVANLNGNNTRRVQRDDGGNDHTPPTSPA